MILPFEIPQSAVQTWGLMAALAALAALVRYLLSEEGMSRLEMVFEMFTEQLLKLIREIVRSDPRPYVPLIGTLFIFIFAANLMGMVPGLHSPTADLSVTAGLAAVVFFCVPAFGIRAQGWGGYFGQYVKPNPLLLPFNILSELSRTMALAVRLFGNIMSGEFLLVVVIGVVTTLLRGYASVFIPFTFLLTLFLAVLSLITAVIHAYIFTVLALVYIGAAVERRPAVTKDKEAPPGHESDSEQSPQEGE